MWWVRTILSFYRKADFFDGSIITNGQDGILRDRSYWNYKMSCKDNFAVKIAGTDVLLKTNGTLTIGDVNVNKETDFLPILRRLKLLSLLTFNVHLIFCMSPDTLLHEKLRKVKEGTQALPVGFINLNEAL